MNQRVLGFRPEKFVTSSRRPPPQAGRMTWTKLYALIKAGYGQGHLYDYLPFLRVTKKDWSDKANMGHHRSAAFGHTHHYRSSGERWLIHLLKWLGAYDARDQYPMWPWAHEHPLCGLPGFSSDIEVPGTLEIARARAIKLWKYVGSDVPYIYSIDVLSTWKHESGEFELIGHDCKPKEQVENARPSSRLLAKLELMRSYCRAAQCKYVLTHPERIGLHLQKNLGALDPRLTQQQIAALRSSSLYQHTVDYCLRWAYQMPASTAGEEVAKANNCPPAEVFRALRAAIWFQDFDHDISAPLELYQPLIRGGLELRLNLFERWCKERQ